MIFVALLAAMIATTLSFSTPLFLALAAALTCAASVIALVRKPNLPRGAIGLAGAGLCLLVLAAGSPILKRPSPQSVAVMVDLSPSTRGAGYRDRDRLDSRIRTLLGKTPYRIFAFATGAAVELPPGKMLPDIAADQTVFNPPAEAAAIVLFSDGRFEAPAAAPPTFVVVDPQLESPADAAVVTLQSSGRNLIAAVSNSGQQRAVSFNGCSSIHSAVAAPGRSEFALTPDATATQVAARLAVGDLWPENDQLVAPAPVAERREKWWVGATAPGADWRIFSPGMLPTDSSAYLAPSVIVLENIAAPDLSELQQLRLDQYVRDLGGGLILLGGNRAFAAGGWPGSQLEALSPLASTPPTPTTHWILLADSSGSMADVQAGASLWRHATDAIVKLLPHVPPDDVLSIGSFSDSITWWFESPHARSARGISLPPANVSPHGPTNLEDALKSAGEKADGLLPAQLLLLTDAEAEIRDEKALENLFKRKHIGFHLLAIGEGSALPILRKLSDATGGSIVKELDPKRWTAGIAKLLRAGQPELLGDKPFSLRGSAEMPISDLVVSPPWNHVWPKPAATVLATSIGSEENIAAAARWNVGEGRVAAAAFDARVLINQLIPLVGQAPKDPRFRVTWTTGPRLRVMLDAAENTNPLNRVSARLQLNDASTMSAAPETISLDQSAPGRYEASIPAPRKPMLASLTVDGRTIDRIAVAGRYAPEFDAIGNDHDAIEQLARQTGGGIIAANQNWPIGFHWPDRQLAVAPFLELSGAALVLMALIWWKLKG